MGNLYKPFALLISGLIMVSGCNNMEETDNLQPSVKDLPPYSVSFRLGGSAELTENTADTRTIHSDIEKTVKSLYALVFTNAEGGGTTGDNDPEDNDKDIFFTAIQLDLTDIQSNNLSFSVGEKGNFQVCFVANPSPSLQNSINGLMSGTSKVADFKALVEENVLDGTVAPYQYLMTSVFYTLSTDFETVQTISTVTLTRTMARFDIVNEADGYTITGVVFHNRATKTPLISDTPSYIEGYVTPTTEYNVGLVGSSSNPASCTETIYSFEQYAGSQSASFDESIDGLPYLEIKYTMPSVSETRIYSHNVYFKKAKDNPEDGYDVLPVKRNTLYKIKMMNSNDTKLTLEVSVLDWNDGSELVVPIEDLINGLKP